MIYPADNVDSGDPTELPKKNIPIHNGPHEQDPDRVNGLYPHSKYLLIRRRLSGRHELKDVYTTSQNFT